MTEGRAEEAKAERDHKGGALISLNLFFSLILFVDKVLLYPTITKCYEEYY